MSYHDHLVADIHHALDALEAEQKPWQAAWVAHAICSKHRDGIVQGEHSEFWQYCGYEECRDLVRRCINKRAGDKPEHEGPQLSLPGYQRLQSYYIVRREGEDVGVSVYELTDEELDDKEATYRALGEGCFAHANEINRFKKGRKADVDAIRKEADAQLKHADALEAWARARGVIA